MENITERKEAFRRLGLNLSTRVTHYNAYYDIARMQETESEAAFVERLLNVLHAWDQAKQCPCSDCTKNFVIRAMRLKEVMHR